MNQTQLQELLSTTQIDMGSIVAMLVFSTIGIIYYRKGKNNGDTIMAICGVGLFLYGYFVYDFVYLLIVGIALTIVPQIKKFL